MPTVHHSDQFSWDANKKQLYADASDIGITAGMTFGPIFNDACDQGLFVMSRRSGRIAVFALVREIKDREGEVTGWEFEATRPHQSMFRFGMLASFRDYEGITIKLFND